MVLIFNPFALKLGIDLNCLGLKLCKVWNHGLEFVMCFHRCKFFFVIACFLMQSVEVWFKSETGKGKSLTLV